jgi:hypothetical protein
MGMSILLAMGFLLCVSLGTIFTGSIAIIVAILTNENKKEAFLYYLKIFLIGLIFAALAYPGMGNIFPLGLIPLALSCLCIPVDFVLTAIARKLENPKKHKMRVAIILGFAIIASLTTIAVIVSQGFILERFSNISNNAFAAERITFFKDAFKIGEESPIIGFGAGAFETKNMLVQNTYYESKFVHNNYLQVFVEAGIVGVIFYITMLGYALLRIIKGWRSGSKRCLSLLPIFVLVLIHSAIDFEMSLEFFMIVFYILLAVVAAESNNCHCPPVIASHSIGIISVFIIPILALLLCFGRIVGLFGIFNIADEDGTVPLENLTAAVQKGVKIDPLHADDYKLTYVVMLSSEELETDDASRVKRYVDNLAKSASESVDVCSALSDYYYYQGDLTRALQYIVLMTKTRPHDASIYDAAFEMCDIIEVDADEISREQIMKTVAEIAALKKGI